MAPVVVALMGAWGTGPFDNDDAADWRYLLLDGGGPEVVEAALRSGSGAEAVAAAAVVGLAHGATVDVPDDVVEWLGAQDPADLTALAGAAVVALDRVLDGSELAELWREAGDDSWEDDVRGLADDLRPG